MQLTPDDIRELRSQRGETQFEFAERIGFSPRTIQQWEQGLRQPGARTTQRLIALLSPADQRRARSINAIENAIDRAQEADRPDIAHALQRVLDGYIV